MATRVNEPIASWESGDSIRGFVLLSRKEEREDRNGRKYLDMEVTDASGSMAAKVWADSAALANDFDAHEFVAIKGSVKLYRESLQLSVDDCRRVRDTDRDHGFDPSKLIPTSEESPEQLWSRLESIYPARIERPILRRLVSETLEAHGAELKLHPAAKTMHHAYLCGLLEHVVSMAEVATRVCDHYREVDRDLVLVGVLFHDLGKIREIGAMPANDYTLEGRLIGHTIIGRDLLLARCAAIEDFPPELRLLLEHLILSHQGKKEYSAPVEPMTMEAVVLHFIDDLDAKLNQLHYHRKSGGGLQFIRGLGRYIYLDPPSDGLGGQGAAVAKAPAGEGAAKDEAEDDGDDDEVPQASLFGAPSGGATFRD
jgi:3'-5' exoribonuclease